MLHGGLLWLQLKEPTSVKGPFLTLNAKKKYSYTIFYESFSVFDYVTELEKVIWSNYSQPLQLALVLIYTKYIPRFKKMTKILKKLFSFAYIHHHLSCSNMK